MLFKEITAKKWVFLIVWLFSSPSSADQCSLQSTGEITPDSAENFETFVKHAQFVPEKSVGACGSS